MREQVRAEHRNVSSFCCYHDSFRTQSPVAQGGIQRVTDEPAQGRNRARLIALAMAW